MKSFRNVSTADLETTIRTLTLMAAWFPEVEKSNAILLIVRDVALKIKGIVEYGTLLHGIEPLQSKSDGPE